MADAANFEYFNVGILSGDLVVNNLELTGWGAAPETLREKTYKGRLWGRIVQDGADDIFELWSRPEFTDATKRVAVSDPITPGPITFDEDNSSGFSGSCDVDYTAGEEQAFDVIVSYCSEEDMARIYEQIEGELSNDQYAGVGVRFEEIIKQVKRDVLDPMIYERYSESMSVDELGRPNLAVIANPFQLASVHARLVIAAIYERRANNNPEMADLADRFSAIAIRAFKNMRVALDLTRDKEIDENERPDHTLDRA